jgi:hypothetical protein
VHPPGLHQYLFVSNSMPDSGDSRNAPYTGEISRWSLDARSRQVRQGSKALKEFSTVHEIDRRNPNELFVSEITDWRVRRSSARRSR